MDTIAAIRATPYRLPFRRGLSTAHGIMAARSGAIIELRMASGLCGIGEVAPLPEFGGDLAADLAALPIAQARLHGKSLDDALAQLASAGKTHALPPALICGLECALLDAQGQACGVRVADLLCPDGGAVLAEVPLNALIGASKIEDAVEQARAAIAVGFPCVKLKLAGEPRAALERVAAVRVAIGPETHLRLDANEGWNFDQACEALNACAQYAIQYIEQPLPAGDLEGMRRLRACVPVPLAADEALRDLASARRILEAEAADVLIIKPQLAGGLRAGRRIIREAAARGVQCVVTSALEAGIGVAGALHLAAASPEITLECGLATLHLLADDLLEDALPVRAGRMALLRGAGLAVRLDRAALAHYHVEL